MDLKEPLIKANRVLKYSITYQEITEESREYGEVSDSGFIIENETDEIGNLLKLAVETYGIYYPVAFGWWESTYPVQNRDYFEKGIEIYYALHITNEDGTDITENESDFITFLLSDGNYNKDEFTEYAIGGIVAGAIALGIGGLIAYYYFNKGKKGYPTGRAWTKEHYNDNDDEDYEISQNERNIKHKARNRQFDNGGGVENTFVNVLLDYGFVEKRSSYGVRHFYNKFKNSYASLDDKQRMLNVYIDDDMIVQGRDYDGYSIRELINFLNTNEYESGFRVTDYDNGGEIKVGDTIYRAWFTDDDGEKSSVIIITNSLEEAEKKADLIDNGYGHFSYVSNPIKIKNKAQLFEEIRENEPIYKFNEGGEASNNFNYYDGAGARMLNELSLEDLKFQLKHTTKPNEKERIALLEKLIKQKSNKFDNGEQIIRFDRHASMDSATRNELVEMTSYPFLLEYDVEENGEIKYDRIQSLLEREGVKVYSIKNYLSGLFDGYNYSNTDDFKKEMAKLKIADKEFYDRIIKVYEKISKYPKIDKMMDNGGGVGEYFKKFENDFSSTRKGGVKNYSVDIDLENGEQLRGGDLDFKDGNDALFLFERIKKKGEYQNEKIEDIQLIANFKNGDYESVDIPRYADGGGVENAEMPTRERTTITRPTTTPTEEPKKPDRDNPYKPKHIPKPKARK